MRIFKIAYNDVFLQKLGIDSSLFYIILNYISEVKSDKKSINFLISLLKKNPPKTIEDWNSIVEIHKSNLIEKEVIPEFVKIISGNKKYWSWILRLYNIGKIKEEDFKKIYDLLSKYDKLISENKIPIENRDINKYQDDSELFQYINTILKQDRIQKSIFSEEIFKNGGVVLDREEKDGDEIVLVKIKNSELMSRIAKNTNWCVINENTANNYGFPFYCFLINEEPEVLIHLSREHIRDTNDNILSDFYIISLIHNMLVKNDLFIDSGDFYQYKNNLIKINDISRMNDEELFDMTQKHISILNLLNENKLYELLKKIDPDNIYIEDINVKVLEKIAFFYKINNPKNFSILEEKVVSYLNNDNSRLFTYNKKIPQILHTNNINIEDLWIQAMSKSIFIRNNLYKIYDTIKSNQKLMQEYISKICSIIENDTYFYNEYITKFPKEFQNKYEAVLSHSLEIGWIHELEKNPRNKFRIPDEIYNKNKERFDEAQRIGYEALLKSEIYRYIDIPKVIRERYKDKWIPFEKKFLSYVERQIESNATIREKIIKEYPYLKKHQVIGWENQIKEDALSFFYIDDDIFDDNKEFFDKYKEEAIRATQDRLFITPTDYFDELGKFIRDRLNEKEIERVEQFVLKGFENNKEHFINDYYNRITQDFAEKYNDILINILIRSYAIQVEKYPTIYADVPKKIKSMDFAKTIFEKAFITGIINKIKDGSINYVETVFFKEAFHDNSEDVNSWLLKYKEEIQKAIEIGKNNLENRKNAKYMSWYKISEIKEKIL